MHRFLVVASILIIAGYYYLLPSILQSTEESLYSDQEYSDAFELDADSKQYIRCEHELCDSAPLFGLPPVDPQIGFDAYGTNHSARARFKQPIEILELLRNRQFTELEQYYEWFNEQFMQGEIPEAVYIDAFQAGQFWEFSVTDDQFLDDWVGSFPNSYIAHGIRGFYYSHLGWKMRGGGYASDTSEMQFQQMEAKFREAMTSLDDSLALNPRFLVAHRYRINIARGSSELGNAKDFYTDAEVYFPYSFNLKAEYMTDLEPRWGGTYEAMRQFALESQENAHINPRLRALLGYEEADKAAILFDQGLLNQAEVAYTNALFHGDIGSHYIQRATINWQLVRRDQYLQDHRYVTENLPNNYALSWIRVGYDHEENGRLEDAKHAFLQAKGSDQTFYHVASIASNLAEYDFEGTIQMYSELFDRNPKNPFHALALHWAYRDAHDPRALDFSKTYTDLCATEYCYSEDLELVFEFQSCVMRVIGCPLPDEAYVWAIEENTVEN